MLNSLAMQSNTDIKTLFEAGAHFGYSRARRHPTATPYLFGTKDRNDIFDLEDTQKRLDAASAFAGELAKSGKHLLFVSGKNEAISIIKEYAERIGAPYVAGRWIGGTLTNFKNIRKRIDRLEKLMSERESGALEKYTKRERLMIDREIIELLGRFGGLVKITDLPVALFIVDSLGYACDEYDRGCVPRRQISSFKRQTTSRFQATGLEVLEYRNRNLVGV